MLPIDVDVVRMTVHVLAATIWVGGQIVLAVLVGPLRRAAPESVAPAARAFAWVAWPAFAVLVATGMWNLQVGGRMSPGGMDGGYGTTLVIKMGLVLLSGVGAALHTFTKNPALKGIWGVVALVGALGAVLFGVALG